LSDSASASPVWWHVAASRRQELHRPRFGGAFRLCDYCLGGSMYSITFLARSSRSARAAASVGSAGGDTSASFSAAAARSRRTSCRPAMAVSNSATCWACRSSPWRISPQSVEPCRASVSARPQVTHKPFWSRISARASSCERPVFPQHRGQIRDLAVNRTSCAPALSRPRPHDGPPPRRAPATAPRQSDRTAPRRNQARAPGRRM